MQRKVIDSNQLRSESLRRYLKASRQNFAVMTDYVAMEAYKGNALITITESMEIVSDYPGQVIVLKGTRDVSVLSGRLAGLQSRMIDEHQTRGFATFARFLKVAQRGDLEIQRQILDNGKAATAHMENMLTTAAEITAVIAPLVRDFSDENKAEIRNSTIGSQELINKIIGAVLEISAQVYRSLPGPVNLPTFKELPNTLVFRAVLCCYLMVIERGANGGGAPVIKVRNDMVDMYIAAYATFFDGVLSRDGKLTRIHYLARTILKELPQ